MRETAASLPATLSLSLSLLFRIADCAVPCVSFFVWWLLSERLLFFVLFWFFFFFGGGGGRRVALFVLLPQFGWQSIQFRDAWVAGFG